MLHKFENSFYEICKQIISENKSLEEWAEIESDDMFQSDIYEGGFDATGMEFCFSVYIQDVEYWFHVSLESIYEINKKNIKEVEVTKAD
jgi:hypothetical protein